MARVKGPLLSLDACGTLAREIRFRHASGQVLVYRDGAPGSVRRRPPSAAQQAQRVRYAAAVASWRALDASQHQAWQAQARASGRALTGWNLYLADRLRAVPPGPVPYQPPPLTQTMALRRPYTPPPLAQILIFSAG